MSNNYETRLAEWLQLEPHLLASVQAIKQALPKTKATQKTTEIFARTDVAAFTALFESRQDTSLRNQHGIISDHKIPLGFKEGETFVDMGSGTGLLAAAMASIFKIHAVGIEIQPRLAQIADNLVQEYDESTQNLLDLGRGDLTDYEFMKTVCARATLFFWTNYCFNTKDPELGIKVTKTLAKALVAARNHQEPLWLITSDPLIEQPRRARSNKNELNEGYLGEHRSVKFCFRWKTPAIYEWRESHTSEQFFYVYTLHVQDTDAMLEYLESRKNEFERVLFNPNSTTAETEFTTEAVIKNLRAPQRCHFCITPILESDEISICASCTLAIYCSNECCAKDAAGTHRHECDSLQRWALSYKRFLNEDSMAPRLKSWWMGLIPAVLRFLAMIARDVAQQKFELSKALADQIFGALPTLEMWFEREMAASLLFVVDPRVLHRALQHTFTITTDNILQLLVLLLRKLSDGTQNEIFFCINYVPGGWGWSIPIYRLRHCKTPHAVITKFADEILPDRLHELDLLQKEEYERQDEEIKQRLPPPLSDLDRESTYNPESVNYDKDNNGGAVQEAGPINLVSDESDDSSILITEEPEDQNDSIDTIADHPVFQHLSTETFNTLFDKVTNAAKATNINTKKELLEIIDTQILQNVPLLGTTPEKSLVPGSFTSLPLEPSEREEESASEEILFGFLKTDKYIHACVLNWLKQRTRQPQIKAGTVNFNKSDPYPAFVEFKQYEHGHVPVWRQSGIVKTFTPSPPNYERRPVLNPPTAVDIFTYIVKKACEFQRLSKPAMDEILDLLAPNGEPTYKLFPEIVELFGGSDEQHSDKPKLLLKIDTIRPTSVSKVFFVLDSYKQFVFLALSLPMPVDVSNKNITALERVKLHMQQLRDLWTSRSESFLTRTKRLPIVDSTNIFPFV